MFCKKCGASIDDEAVVCPKCGCKTENYEEKVTVKEEPDKATGGMIVLSILLPIVGVIAGIVNLCKKKTKSGTTYLIVGIVAWIIGAIVISGLY